MNVDEINARIDDLQEGERFSLCGVPDEIYHQTKGIGSTKMREAFKSMAHYQAICEKEFTRTADMIMGSAIHALVLEPDLYEQKVIELPDGIVRGKSVKYKNFAAKHPEKLHLKTEELAEVDNISTAVLNQCPQLFVGGEAEKSYWYKHHTGLILKARIDYEIADCGIDLKSTRKETQGTFEITVRADYAVQDCLYRLVTGLNDLFFVGVSKVRPHQCFGVRQGSDVRQKTESKMESVIKEIIFANELQSFAFPQFTVTDTTLPAWER